MAWPKGKPRKFETKSDVLPPVKVDQKPEERQEWTPKPDMGSITPPPPGDSTCTTCRHKGGMHYGGPKGWCNTGGCKCQEFAQA